MFIKKFFIVFIQIMILSVFTYANLCPKWFPMPTSDGLVVVLPIYDESITEPDLDCDGIVDTVDNDIDGDGVRNTLDAFPLNSSEFIDTDGDGIGNNADSDDDNDGTVDSEDSNPLVNEIPIANAGDDLRNDINTTITLDASASTDDGNILTYNWVMTSKPEGSTATLNNRTSVAPTFYGDKVGAYRFELVVSDGILTSVKDVLFVNVGRESMLLAFDDGVHGVEPWITDGTVEGTHLLKDINLKNESSDIRNMVDAGDVIYFSVKGNELWKSDGSEEGTVKITTLDSVSNIYQFTMVLNRLYFIDSNNNLWKSDGTELGTLKINGYYSNPTDLIEYNNELYFSARAGSYGRELWKSDGTETGTTMVKDIKEGTLNSNPSDFLKVNGLLFFTVIDENGHTAELWKTDGTSINTVLVKEFNSDIYQNIRNLTDVNGTLFFSADDGIHGRELWKSNGTEIGTVMVKDIMLGMKNSDLENLTTVDNLIYFTFFNAENTSKELWKSDGTEEGTVKVTSLSYWGSHLISYNHLLYYKDDNGFWKSDGTEAGTKLIKEYTSFISGYFTVFNGYLYFIAENDTGYKLVKSDGSEEGTYNIKDINNGDLIVWSGNFTIRNNIIFFLANDGINGRELWKSDGTEVGTSMVKNITTNTFSSISIMNSNFTKIGNIYYFIARDINHGYELWKSDGTKAGTVMVRDIWSGQESSSPSNLVVLNDTIYFTTNDISSSKKIWKSDGTEIGTVPFLNEDIYYPDNLLVMNDILYFTQLHELWKSDGTDVGTSKVVNIPESSRQYIVINDLIYFTAFDDKDNTNSLWRSDGTGVGTYIIKHDVSISHFTVFNDMLYFINNNHELWKSNGLSLGTILLKDIESYISNLIVVDNRLYLISDSKIWQSKNNSDSMYTEIIQENDFGYLNNFIVVNDTLYYSKYEKLWKINNTSFSTKKEYEFGITTSIRGVGSLNGELIWKVSNVTEYNLAKLWKTNTIETIQLTP